MIFIDPVHLLGMLLVVCSGYTCGISLYKILLKYLAPYLLHCGHSISLDERIV